MKYYFSPLSNQRGVSLLMALIMLVGLMLGSVALFRSVDTSTLIAGNMAYKHSSSLAAERGIQAAVAWLQAQPQAARHFDTAAAGFCSSQHASDGLVNGWDPTTAWTACSLPVTMAPDAAGNQIQYFIHRLCTTPNVPPSAATCSQPRVSSIASNANNSHRGGSEKYGPRIPVVSYRITVRVSAGNGTRSFVQSTVLVEES